MSNGTLVFIVIIELIVIVWQASKLKQYAKLDQMLNNRGATSGGSSGHADQLAGVSGETSLPEASSATAAKATQGVANAISPEDDEDLLRMEGVDPEGNIEEAKRVQLVMARCRYAEFYLEQLDDDYERDQFQRIVNSCKKTARNISDPFFRASALQPLIVLLDRAEWNQERDELLLEVDDELVSAQLSAKLST